MSDLRDQVFKNTENLDEETIKKYKLKSVEDINKDLVEYATWDMVSPVAAVSLTLDNENKINQCCLNIFGETDPKRVEAATVFGNDFKGKDHQIKIERINLQRLRFRGTMVSDWLGPQDFTYVVQRPSISNPGTWKDVDQSRVEAEGGSLLWLRAIAQPWTGLKLKMTIGLMSTRDMARVPDADHPRFPFINILSTHLPILPSPPEEERICLPFIPYLICGQEEDDDSVPNWTTIVKAVNGMFRDTTAPHSKSNMAKLMETLKGDWKTTKMSKFCYPVLVEDENDEEENAEGELRNKYQDPMHKVNLK